MWPRLRPLASILYFPMDAAPFARALQAARTFRGFGKCVDLPGIAATATANKCSGCVSAETREQQIGILKVVREGGQWGWNRWRPHDKRAHLVMKASWLALMFSGLPPQAFSAEACRARP